ncbi:MAG: hypothetical protein JWN87_1739 [Frankiales bacterium]|jgi:hypothetical protein|nr:hypothetical protein [Frankiales bacterium]
MAHCLDVIENDAPVTVPVRRTTAVDWPGDGEVAFIPAALMLAARGRCSCATCVDGFVALLRRSQVRAA